MENIEQSVPLMLGVKVLYIYSMLPWQPFDVVRSYIFVYRPVNL